MFLSSTKIIGKLFLDVLVSVFFNSSFNFGGMFFLFIPIPLHTSFSNDESILSSSSSHLRSVTSFSHPYLHLMKPAQDSRSFSILFFFYITVMFLVKFYNSLMLVIKMTGKFVAVDTMVYNILIVQVFVKWNNHLSKYC